MKTKTKGELRRFKLMMLSYCDYYYIERIARLEKVLSKIPRVLQIDLIGTGEIPADLALLFRAVLMGRSQETQVITNARSSLQGGGAMLWLLGDKRIIREDARMFFRPVNTSETEKMALDEDVQGDVSSFCNADSSTDPEEGDYARMLEVINEFLPVKEMAGRLIGVPVLRQYGLMDNERVDQFLATAFGQKEDPAAGPSVESEERRIGCDKNTPQSRPVKR